MSLIWSCRMLLDVVGLGHMTSLYILWNSLTVNEWRIWRHLQSSHKSFSMSSREVFFGTDGHHRPSLCWLVVWNMFYFPIYWEIIIPIDFHIFQRGSNHQPLWRRSEPWNATELKPRFALRALRSLWEIIGRSRRHEHLHVTLWETNITMENHPILMGKSTKNGHLLSFGHWAVFTATRRIPLNRPFLVRCTAGHEAGIDGSAWYLAREVVRVSADS